MSKPRSTLGKVVDFFEGVQRYDSADYPNSAPEMAKRKAASQGPAKTGLKAGAQTSSFGDGQKVEKAAKPIAKKVDTTAGPKAKAARY